jgi:hypothetical protein
MSFLQAFELSKRFAWHDIHFFTDGGQLLREPVLGDARVNERPWVQEQQG